VFIIAVVISGSILTWFSINNISNLKELTEKRIIEEERELFFRLQDSIQTKINNLTSAFSGRFDAPWILKDSLLKVSSENEFSIFPFILNNNGEFIFPNFIQIQETSKGYKSSNSFITTFEGGVKAEFISKDFNLAEKYYSACLKYSAGPADSVKVLNVLARLNIKSNQPEKALSGYQSIISKYYSEPGPDGLPYAYFAISQLIKIDDPSSIDQILSILDSCLVKIEKGAIPLSYSTEDLLIRVNEWIEHKNFANNQTALHIENLIQEINEQIWFINKYGDEIKVFLSNGSQKDDKNIVNGFKTADLIKKDTNKLLLFNPDQEKPFGFVIDNREFFASLLKPGYQDNLNYEYLVEFPESPRANNNYDNLIYSTQLNPFFPGQEIRISLVQENLVNEFVNRRSYIYGVALLLLLLGMVLGIVLILRDLSREKRLSQLQADFTSNVTHELKTPITSIYLFAESMFFDKLKSRAEEKEYLSIIMKESERLKRMINNILEHSKMEKGRQEYHFAEANLSALIKEVIHEMTYWFEEKQITVHVDVEENISLTIDKEKIMQAFSNLLSNAIKFSDEGTSIKIQLFKKTDHTVLSVKDEGIGIPKDQHKKIFEKFYRVGQKETESISGTGLGLTVVKEIVEAHKGEIIVESEPGKGSKFSIILDNRKSKA
jgi:two-component system phosphate regulon sensor histidine kinase PhoR